MMSCDVTTSLGCLTNPEPAGPQLYWSGSDHESVYEESADVGHMTSLNFNHTRIFPNWWFLLITDVNTDQSISDGLLCFSRAAPSRVSRSTWRWLSGSRCVSRSITSSRTRLWLLKLDCWDSLAEVDWTGLKPGPKQTDPRPADWSQTSRSTMLDQLDWWRWRIRRVTDVFHSCIKLCNCPLNVFCVYVEIKFLFNMNCLLINWSENRSEVWL